MTLKTKEKKHKLASLPKSTMHYHKERKVKPEGLSKKFKSIVMALSSIKKQNKSGFLKLNTKMHFR